MKQIYLCGGINGLDDSQCKDWREEAKAQFSGYCIDPMRRDYRGREERREKEIVHNDIKDIIDCNYILANVSRPSWGTAMEIRIAMELNRPVIGFGVPDNISPWLKYHCEALFENLEEAINYINLRAQV